MNFKEGVLKVLIKLTIFMEFASTGENLIDLSQKDIMQLWEGYEHFLVWVLPIIIDGVVYIQKLPNFKEIINMPQMSNFIQKVSGFFTRIMKFSSQTY